MSVERDVARPDSLDRVERLAAVALTIAALALHALFLTHAGPLWRDEINSLHMSQLDFATLWQNLEFDSFPVGYFTFLKGWTAMTPDGDVWLRVLGVLVGMAIVGAVWSAGLSMTGRPPLLAITLLLFDAATVRFGDSLRGYGLGMLLAVGAYWSLWRLGERRDLRAALVAGIVSVLAVQTLYYNAIVVFAGCVGAIARNARDRSARDFARPLAVGLIAALTLVPYGSVFARARDWNDLVRGYIDLPWIHWTWRTAHAGSGSVTMVLWDLVLVAGFALALVAIGRGGNEKGVDRSARHHAWVFLAGTVTYVGFLFALSYYMAPWYYLVLSLLVALSVDALLASFPSRLARGAVIVIALAHLATAARPATELVSVRFTNADLVAKSLSAEARPGDLILVFPWQGIVSWSRYYDGPARAESLPPLSFSQWHRYDLYLRTLRDPSSTSRLFGEVEVTLARGDRVSVVRTVGWNGRTPPSRPPARFEGQNTEYVALEEFLARHGARLVETGRWPRGSEYETFIVERVVPAAPSPPRN